MEKKDIFNRLFSGTATEEDLVTLDSILETGDIASFDEYCRQFWNGESVELSDTDKAIMKSVIMKKIADNERRAASRKRLNFIRWVGAAAAVLLLFFVLSPVSIFNGRHEPDYFEVVVDRGQKSTLTLPDGSKVWINSATIVSYSSDYNVKDRDVYLTGEAYFEVASGNVLPFTVHASDLQVTALGTKFNVKAYSEEDMVMTTLIEGKVSTEAGSISRILAPYQEAIYEKAAGTIAVSDVTDQLHAVPWIKNEILFDNDSLADIAVSLERMYNVNVIFADEKVKEYSYTGLIRNNSLQNVLELIASTSPVDYRITSGTIKFFVK
jgi:ferric-dicitrate binding protein FerR (iron transport regulator)